MMTKDVQIHFPGPAAIPFAGTHRGAEGVGQFFQTIGTNVTIHQFEPREFIAQGDEVVVLGHEKLTATPTGRAWETDWAMVWTLRDGQVSLLRESTTPTPSPQPFADDTIADTPALRPDTLSQHSRVRSVPGRRDVDGGYGWGPTA